MKAITVRQIPSELAAFIEAEAAKTQSSLNATVIRLLQQVAKPASASEASQKTIYHDLDHLAGSWSKEEADAFDRELAEMRQIDPELWQ